MAVTYIGKMPMLIGSSLYDCDIKTNNISELENRILKYCHKLLKAGRIDVASDIFSQILESEMQLFWLEHEKCFGKTIEAKIKSIITKLDCTSSKNGPNMVERDCHEKWNLLKSKIDYLYGKGSSNEKFMIKLFAQSGTSIGGIQLNHSNVVALNKPTSRLPSYGALFCSVILKFCNDKTATISVMAIINSNLTLTELEIFL